MRAKAIVLHTTPYNDRTQVLHLYTREYGRVGALIPLRRTRGGVCVGMCFPLSLLEVEMDMRAEKKLSRMEECRVLYPLPGLFVDATKNAVSLCTAELLFRLLREPLADGELFDYMEGAIRSLESGVWSAESFLLLFVPGVLGRLGVLPETGTALHVQYFPYLTAAGGLVLEVSEEQRKNGLRLMMKFGRKYVPDFPHLRSLSVLQSLEVL